MENYKIPNLREFIFDVIYFFCTSVLGTKLCISENCYDQMSRERQMHFNLYSTKTFKELKLDYKNESHLCLYGIFWEVSLDQKQHQNVRFNYKRNNW